MTRLTTTPFTLKVNGTKFLAADLTKTNGWGRDAPAQILAVLQRDSAMPLGAPGSSLYAKLGTLSSLPIAEIDQIMGANLILSEQKLSRFTTSIVNPTTRLWFIVELNARLRPLGCPPFSRQLCSTRPMWGTWVSVVDNSNNHVLFTASF